MPAPAQPARKSYFFGKGYHDLWHTIRDGWELNVQSMSKWFKQSEQFFKPDPVSWLAGVFCIVAGLSVLVFGTLFFAVASAVHVVALGAVLLVFYITFTAFYLIERIVMLFYRIFVTCPHCHFRFDVPVYACPVCSAKHTRLIPGAYGIFLRTCSCGKKKLRTSILTGRSNYDASCPNPRCSRSIEDPEVTPYCIPVIGTPNSGKTCFIYTATEAVETEIATANHWSAAVDGRTSPDLAVMRSDVSAGRYPRKTVSRHAQAFSIKIETGSRFPQVIHLYDSAGEAFLGGDALDSHHFYGYSHGFVVLIDANIVLRGKASRGALDNDPEDAFTRMLFNFQKNHDISVGTSVDRPLAVVLNKVDMLNVRTELGSEVDTPETITSEVCANFLKRHGFANLVALINGSFSNVRYFAASTLCQEGARLQPRGIGNVMRWLIAETRLGMGVHDRVKLAAIPLLLVLMAAGSLITLAVRYFVRTPEPIVTPPEVQIAQIRPVAEPTQREGQTTHKSGTLAPAVAPSAPLAVAHVPLLLPAPQTPVATTAPIAPLIIPSPPSRPAARAVPLEPAAPVPIQRLPRALGATVSKMRRSPSIDQFYGREIAEVLWPRASFPAEITITANSGSAFDAGLRGADQIERWDGWYTRGPENRLPMVIAASEKKPDFEVGFYRWGRPNYIIHRLSRTFKIPGSTLFGAGFSFEYVIQRSPFPFITRVIPGSPAEASGLKEGDLIVEVNGKDCRFYLRKTRELNDSITCLDEAKSQAYDAMTLLVPRLRGTQGSTIDLIVCPYRLVHVRR